MEKTITISINDEELRLIVEALGDYIDWIADAADEGIEIDQAPALRLIQKLDVSKLSEEIQVELTAIPSTPEEAGRVLRSLEE